MRDNAHLGAHLSHGTTLNHKTPNTAAGLLTGYGSFAKKICAQNLIPKYQIMAS
ncbi:hypothetical protein Lspi_1901 [Legionella spiritensis]|uniref:Uncharacterized protein n=1 Tax=Legionella spiritensis TaxID=452 RepID=A0A0W0YZM1_LEGSP|nr:hypothetical protein Lspi_1901 [Legionella spiritensis]SNV34488.1 Uncharacterised protein [Legionella spiritensis]